MDTNQNEVYEVEFRELFSVLLKNWVTIVLGIIVGCTLATGLTIRKPDMYRSEVKMYTNLSKTGSVADVINTLRVGDEMSNDYIEIAKSKPVLDQVIVKIKKEQNRELSRSQVLKMMNVTVKEDTHILQIAVTHENPQLACSVANALAEATAKQIAYIMKGDAPTTLESAEVASKPQGNGLVRNVLLGFMGGLLLSILLVLVPHLLNDTIQDEEEIEKYMGEAVLAVIPIEKTKGTRLRTKKKR